MIPKGLFTEIIIIAISVGIVFTYIQPTFAEITKTQDDILVFRTERQKIAEVNQELAALVSKVDSVSALDRRKLLTYLPDQVDTVAVPRTLSFIVEDAGLILNQISYGGALKTNNMVDETAPVAHVFSLQVEGTYAQIKQLLALMERNEYPLEVTSLSISVLNGGFLSAQMQVVTYSYYEPTVSAFGNNRNR